MTYKIKKKLLEPKASVFGLKDPSGTYHRKTKAHTKVHHGKISEHQEKKFFLFCFCRETKQVTLKEYSQHLKSNTETQKI